MTVPPLEFLFPPRSVAVVGASRNPSSQGHKFIRDYQDFGFKGAIYPVNPREQEVSGLPCYPSLLDVPGPADFVISAVPAPLVPQLARDCVAKGVKCLHLFTARLLESGLPERIAMEEELVRTAKSGGMRVIGPNCMGIYNPSEGMSFRYNFPKEPGKVAFFSQSGGNTAELVHKGVGRGLRFSKVVSYGNACDLNEADFLEYSAHDPETEVIAAYIEGVREGRRFFAALREAALRKPVVVLKGGRSTSGNRAAMSHTASLSGSAAIWNTVFHQAGAVRARSMEDLADLALAFQWLPPLTARRLAVMGGGGGNSVQAADLIEDADLVIPPLPEEIREQLREKAPEVWSLISNPVDSSVMGGPTAFGLTCQLLAHHPGIDWLFGNAAAEWGLEEQQGVPSFLKGIRELIRLSQDCGKPLIVASGATDNYETWKQEAIVEGQRICAEAHVPFYPSLERAAGTLSRVIGYYDWRSTQ